MLRLILIAKKQQHRSITHGNHDRQRKMTTVLCIHQLLATLADVPLRTLLMYCCVCSCIVLPLSSQHFCFSPLDIHKILTINKVIRNLKKNPHSKQNKGYTIRKDFCQITPQTIWDNSQLLYTIDEQFGQQNNIEFIS